MAALDGGRRRAGVAHLIDRVVDCLKSMDARYELSPNTADDDDLFILTLFFGYTGMINTLRVSIASKLLYPFLKIFSGTKFAENEIGAVLTHNRGSRKSRLYEIRSNYFKDLLLKKELSEYYNFDMLPSPRFDNFNSIGNPRWIRYMS